MQHTKARRFLHNPDSTLPSADYLVNEQSVPRDLVVKCIFRPETSTGVAKCSFKLFIGSTLFCLAACKDGNPVQPKIFLLLSH